MIAVGIGVVFQLLCYRVLWAIATFPGEWQEESCTDRCGRSQCTIASSAPNPPIHATPVAVSTRSSCRPQCLRGPRHRRSREDEVAGFRLPPPRARSERRPLTSPFWQESIHWRPTFGGLARAGAASGRFAPRGDLQGASFAGASFRAVAGKRATPGRVVRGARCRHIVRWRTASGRVFAEERAAAGRIVRWSAASGRVAGKRATSRRVVRGCAASGVSFKYATLQATDLSRAFSGGAIRRESRDALGHHDSGGRRDLAPAVAVEAEDRVWNYEQWRASLELLLPSGPLLEPALTRIEVLDCFNPDKTLQSCDRAATCEGRRRLKNAVAAHVASVRHIAPRLLNLCRRSFVQGTKMSLFVVRHRP